MPKPGSFVAKVTPDPSGQGVVIDVSGKGCFVPGTGLAGQSRVLVASPGHAVAKLRSSFAYPSDRGLGIGVDTRADGSWSRRVPQVLYERPGQRLEIAAACNDATGKPVFVYAKTYAFTVPKP